MIRGLSTKDRPPRTPSGVADVALDDREVEIRVDAATFAVGLPLLAAP